MNGMKQGLIIGAVAGLFFGFMMGRYGLNQQQHGLMNAANKPPVARPGKTRKPGSAKPPVKFTGLGNYKRYKIPVANAPSKGPKAALVTIVEFCDFQCPFCRRGTKTMKQILKNYGNKVRLVFRHRPLSFHPYAFIAAQAAMAANAQGKFWPYHDLLFANQRNLQKSKLIEYAKQLGLDLKKFKAALDAGTYKNYINKDSRFAGTVGANGTPTFFINGRRIVGALPYNRFKRVIDQEILIAQGLLGKGVKLNQIYAKFMSAASRGRRIVVKRRARNNRRKQVKLPPKGRMPNIEGAPALGPKNAPVTIVEFSDFQCPFCRRGAATIKRLKKAYGDKVRLVFKHLPLSFHRHAYLAAQAAMAAHAQGKFWEYHDKLFNNNRQLGKENYIKWAKELGLDVARFKKELESGKYQAYINKDKAEARSLGANGTPTFFINGRKVVGALPYSRFKEIVDALLAPKKPVLKILPNLRLIRPVKIQKKEKYGSVDGSPAWGPKDAPVTIVEYSDFQCPFCHRAAATIKKIKQAYGDKVRLIFKHLPLSFHRNAHIAAEASMCAHAQGKFWAFHDKLFANSHNLSRENFIKWAKELGLDVEKFKKDFDSGKYKTFVDKNLIEAGRRGARGTPTFFINGKKLVGAQPYFQFKRAIDEALAAKAGRPAPNPLKGFEDKLKGAPALGPKNAPVTIIEFSDFQCPFCRRAASTIKRLKKAYGDKVRLVFKHLPLGFHRYAHIAAEASMAAHAQGKFWEFHDKLFNNNRNLSRENFIKWAKELGLNVEKFKKDLDSHKYKAYVDNDARQAGHLGASGTPTFFINGKRLVGAQPYYRFKQAVDEALAGGKKAPTRKEIRLPTIKKNVPKNIKIGKAPVWGPKNAKITIVEFSDFQCPFSRRAFSTTKQLMKEYKGKIRLVYKHLPLGFHRHAQLAAEASMAAHAQGKFWQYREKLFNNNRNLSKENFIKWAKELGLDVVKFKKDLDSRKYKAYVEADARYANSVGANGTPTFFINGHILVGAQPIFRFKQIIDALLAGKKIPTNKPRPARPRRPAGPIKIKIGKAPVWGPKNAKITIVEFSDFQCPFSRRGFGTTKQLMKEYKGKIRLVYKHLPLSFHRHAQLAAEASMAAHAQGKFWQYREKLFNNNRNLSKENFIKWAKELGLDVVKFKKDLDSRKYKAYVEADARYANSVGANGTPTFFINGHKLVGAQPIFRFKAMIDALLAGKKIPTNQPRRRRRRPTGPIKIKIGKAPIWGPKNAKITIVEFSDFQCPFSRRGFGTTKQLMKEYKGKLRLVYKHLPLSFHRHAHLAAEASMAAHAQGKFWQYREKLFNNQRSLSKENFIKWAKELGLDVDKFKKDLDSHKYKAYVDADARYASSVGANGTPTFFINGHKLVGAQPIFRFKAMIDALLAGKKIPSDPPRRPRRPAGRVKIKVGKAPVLGPKNAKVTIIEFSDFQCPFCRRAANTVKRLVKAYPKKVRLVFKHLPLGFHRHAFSAALAAMAAHEQGKFWEFHDKLFANNRSLGRANYIKWAKELGLDVAKFTKALDSKKYKDYINADANLARRVGANGTPTFFINGKRLVGAQPYFRFKQMVDAELK